MASSIGQANIRSGVLTAQAEELCAVPGQVVARILRAEAGGMLVCADCRFPSRSPPTVWALPIIMLAREHGTPGEQDEAASAAIHTGRLWELYRSAICPMQHTCTCCGSSHEEKVLGLWSSLLTYQGLTEDDVQARPVPSEITPRMLALLRVYEIVRRAARERAPAAEPSPVELPADTQSPAVSMPAAGQREPEIDTAVVDSIAR